MPAHEGANVKDVARIAEVDLEKWAQFLLEHSLAGPSTGARVMIKGEAVAWPLMEVLERRVIEMGATPDVLLIAPNNDRGRVWSSNMGRYATPDQLAAVPAWLIQRYQEMTHYIEILGHADPQAFQGLAPEQAQRMMAADRPFVDIRVSKPWVLTLYPTAAEAAFEGMSLASYTDFIVRASTVDPAPLKFAEEKLEPLFQSGRQVRIVTHHPGAGRELVLRMDITHSIPRLCYGLRNFPDGEIFTSPNANSVEGEIYVDLPVTHGGVDMQGIHLRFEGGRIVEYSAQAGQKQLETIVETDAGARRLGEFALGMNPGFDKVLKNALFVEKVGGTLHIAIGASYEDCYVEDPGSDAGRRRLETLTEEGIVNVSAQHVDIVTDFRPGGAGRQVFIDDTELVVRDGVWVIAP